MSVEQKLFSENGIRDLGPLNMKALRREIQKINDKSREDPDSVEAKIRTVIVKIEGDEKVLLRKNEDDGRINWEHHQRLTKGIILTGLLNDTGGPRSRFSSG